MNSKTLFFLHNCYFFLIAFLTFFGLLFIYSSSQCLSQQIYGIEWHFVIKQIIGILIGSFLCFMCACISSAIWKKLSFFLFFCSCILCLLTHVSFIGVHINGACRWLNLGVALFQPVEVLKPFSVLFLAKLFSLFFHKINILLWNLMIFFIIISSILLLQPDFGQTIVICGTGFLLFIIIYHKVKIIIGGGFLFSCATIFMILFKSYRLKRILIFLNPWQDPLGRGFQIIQSLIAIVNGQWWGVGFGHSQQKLFYLPMQHTDFIFSIICEEIGLVGVFFVITSLFLMTSLLLFFSYQAKTIFNQVTLLGFAIMFFLQSSINILVSIALFPTKGIGLPFISYGVSSVIGCFIITGIAISLILESKST